MAREGENRFIEKEKTIARTLITFLNEKLLLTYTFYAFIILE